MLRAAAALGKRRVCSRRALASPLSMIASRPLREGSDARAPGEGRIVTAGLVPLEERVPEPVRRATALSVREPVCARTDRLPLCYSRPDDVRSTQMDRARSRGSSYGHTCSAFHVGLSNPRPRCPTRAYRCLTAECIGPGICLRSSLDTRKPLAFHLSTRRPHVICYALQFVRFIFARAASEIPQRRRRVPARTTLLDGCSRSVL